MGKMLFLKDEVENRDLILNAYLLVAGDNTRGYYFLRTAKDGSEEPVFMTCEPRHPYFFKFVLDC